MRVALVYRAFHTRGSLPRAMVQLASHLQQRHDVHVFSIAALTDRTLAPESVFHDVPVRALGDGRGFDARELLPYARNVAKLVRPEDFDIVHACAPSGWVADVLNVPGIMRAEAADQGIPGWRFAASVVRHPGNAARLLIERRAMRSVLLRRIHVQAPSVAVAAERYYGLPREDALLVTPAVSLEEFYPGDQQASRTALELEPDRRVLLFCGSDFYRKGLDRAIAGLATSRVDADLLVVGGGDEAPFRRLAAEHGVEGRVRFLGSIADPARAYWAADVLLLPTRSDVWGITPIEAMACGIPSIVTVAAGCSSAVQEAGAGIVLPEPFDLQALAHAIEELAADAALRAQMGRAGLASAESHSWERRAQVVEEDLIRVANERAS